MPNPSGVLYCSLIKTAEKMNPIIEIIIFPFPLPSGHLDRHFGFLHIVQFHHGLCGWDSHANQDQGRDDSPDDFNCRIFMKLLCFMSFDLRWW
jgi:hypothetical protein